MRSTPETSWCDHNYYALSVDIEATELIGTQIERERHGMTMKAKDNEIEADETSDICSAGKLKDFEVLAKLGH